MLPTHALIKVDAINEGRPQLASQLAELAAETLNVVDTAVAGELRLWCETLLGASTTAFPRELDFIDLFSGCGGRVLGYALDSSSWRGCGVEADAECCRVHEHNLPQFSVFQHKIIATDPLPKGMDTVPPVICSMGPPCQPFSTAGAQRGAEDPRDGFPAALEAIRQIDRSLSRSRR